MPRLRRQGYAEGAQDIHRIVSNSWSRVALTKSTIGPDGRVTLNQARVTARKVFAAKLDGRDLAAEEKDSRRRMVADRVDDLLGGDSALEFRGLATLPLVMLITSKPS
jgi:hypothetical protein